MTLSFFCERPKVEHAHPPFLHSSCCKFAERPDVVLRCPECLDAGCSQPRAQMGDSKRGPYTGRFRVCADDGPATLCVVLGHSGADARWKTEFCKDGNHMARERLNKRLTRAGLPLCSAQANADRRFFIHGFVMALAWHIVMPHQHQTKAGTSMEAMSDEQLMHNIYYTAGPVRPRAVIEIPFVASAALLTPTPLPDSSIAEGSEPLESPRFAQQMWDVLHHGDGLQVQEFSEDGVRTRPLLHVLRQWFQRWHLLPPSNGTPPLIGWRMWTPLAGLAVRAQWPLDMVAVFQRRTLGMHYVRLRHEHPPQKLLQQYLTHQVATAFTSHASMQSEGLNRPAHEATP